MHGSQFVGECDFNVTLCRYTFTALKQLRVFKIEPFVQYLWNDFHFYYSATQMVVDQVCVVKRDGSACVNQDVLFVGTCE